MLINSRLQMQFMMTLFVNGILLSQNNKFHTRQQCTTTTNLRN